jgi:hypothetical protein
MDILGIPQGKQVGYIKKYLENLVIEGKIRNKKRELMKFLKLNKERILNEIKKENF